MGVDYSHAHAACLATQLPKEARCMASDDPHDKWDEVMWMLWRIEYQTRLVRYGVGMRADGEQPPLPLDYPGKGLDEMRAQARREENKRRVRTAYGL